MKHLKLDSGVLPSEILFEIKQVVAILRRHGAMDIILYGSLARGDYRIDSDIDLLVSGLAPREYFSALADILMQSKLHVSLLNMEDIHGYFREKVLREGKIIDDMGRVTT